MFAQRRLRMSIDRRRGALLGGSALIPLALGMYGAPSAHAQAVNLGQSPGNMIATSGRTATLLAVSGRTTTISTSTISGGNAYNSFTQFREGAGNTVNLLVPSSARNLVNVVTGGAVNIQGTLNSYKNGILGGNVIFADSYGFIVGAAGVVNVGSLSVVTPTQATIDQLISPQGVVNNALASQLVHANVPISQDGSVVIAGQVIAQHGVQINAHDVVVAGSVPEAMRAARQRAQFESTVNAKGMSESEGGAIVVRNGAISIVAANNVGIDGALSAAGARRHGGSVSIAAGNNVAIGATGKINAQATPANAKGAAPAAPQIAISAGNDVTLAGALSAIPVDGDSAGRIQITGEDISVASTAKLAAVGVGSADGGGISIKSTGTTTVASGASFAANALGTGDGGLIEISGHVDDVAGGILVNLSSVGGNAGTLLFDPDQLLIGGTLQNAILNDNTVLGTSSLPSLYTDGANVELDANDSITINGVIDTRAYATYLSSPVTGLLSASNVASTGNSGSITLVAPTITINSGGALYADANGKTAGAVTLTASTTNDIAIGYASANSAITIDGAITGASISANATAQAESVYALNSNNSSPGNMATTIGLALLINLDPLNLSPGYVQSNGTATVTVGGTLTAQSNSSGDIDLTAHTIDVSSDPALGLSAASTFIAGGVVVGSTDATAKVEIQSGAHVTGGGTLTAAATNDATLGIKTATITGFGGFQGAPVVISVAYGDSSVNATAQIDSGAHIAMTGAGSAVDILARNDNSFTVGALSYARNGGAVGVAIAISDFNSSAIAHDGANIGTSAAPAGAVTISAQDETASNQTSASGTVGAGAFADFLTALSQGGAVVSQAVSGGGVTAPDTGIVSSLFALSFGKALQTSSVSLPQFAGAVSLSFGTQTAAASVSADAGDSAPAIQASGNVAVESDVTDSAFLNLGTSAVNASANPTTVNPSASFAISVGVAYADVTHDSSAVVGPGVTIDASQIGVEATSSIPSPIENIDWTDFNSVLDGLLANKTIVTTGSNAASASGAGGLGLAGSLDFATFTTNTIAWVGDGSTLKATNTSSGQWTSDLSSLDPKSSSTDVPTTFSNVISVVATTTHETINVIGNAGLLGGNVANGSAAVGASFAMLTDNANTYAGIAQGASIISGDQVYVDAESYARVINASLTNGAGVGLNISGLANLFFLNDNTSASISDKAQITSNSVTVNAFETLGIYSIAGDISFSGSSGFGVAVTYVNLAANTDAYIGDNATVVGTSIDPNEADAPSAAGYVDTGTLDVIAKTSGNVIAASLVSENVDSSAQSPAPIPSSSPAAAILGTVQQGVTANVAISVAGASAVTDSALDTAAYLNGATVNFHGASSAPSVQVEAGDDALIVSGSGGSAITLQGFPRPTSGALSGAISVESSSNNTLAYIESSSVNIDSVDVEALTGGLTVVAGIGLSVNATSGGTSGSLAGSVSVADIDDRVAAYIDDSTVSGSGDAIVLAEQDTEVGIGGGAFFLGGKAGFGLAVTYLDIENPSAGPATDAHISNSNVTGFTDIDVIATAPQIIYSGAATGGTNTTASLGGAFIFNTLDATTSATISNSGATALSITANQNVSVTASTDPNNISTEANSFFLEGDSQSSTYKANYAADPNDSSASDQADAALLSGQSAAIVSVAGIIETGAGTAVGVSVIDNTVDESHVASVSGVTVAAQNAMFVAAGDSTTILAVAVGLGISTEGYAGEGASVTNTISGGPSASVGATGVTAATTIGGAAQSARVGALTISATDSSDITGIALTVSGSEAGAGGVALSTNNIETTTSASIESASVRTTYTSDESFATGDIVVEGQSTGSILAVAMGIAVSGSSWAADGSIATNLAKGDVTSSVDNSTLFAMNNVGVLASNNNSIDTISGAAGIGLATAGIGVSVTTDQVGGGASGNTAAKITSSTVDAEAAGQDTLEIVDGALVDDIAVGATPTLASSAPESPSSSVAPSALPNLGQDVRLDQGVAVVAGSVETSVVTAVTLGVSTGLAAGVDVVTTTMGGYTDATVSGSALDRNLPSSNVASAIDVSAHSVSFANNFAYAVAFSTGDLAGAVTVVTNTMNRTTDASVTSTSIGNSATTPGGVTTLYAPGAVTVEASGWEATAGESIGAAGSDESGGAGSTLSNVFTANTTASLDHGSIIAESLSVAANGTDGLFGATGAGALGDTAGIGASVLVLISKATTQASVGDTDPTTAATSLSLTGPLSVSAATNTDVTSYVIVGALGGTAGIAAQFSGIIVGNTTDAALDNATVTISNTAAANAGVSIASQETDEIDPTVGGASAGGTAGIGASVNLVMLKSDDAAWMAGDTVATPGAVDVTSLSTRDVNPIAVTIGLGGDVGISGTVGVVLVGSGASSAELGVLNAGGTLSNADGAASSDLTTEVGGGVDGISAEILNGSVTAGSVNVAATTELAVRNIAGALGVGIGAVGIGAGIAYTDVSQNVTAEADGGSVTAPAVTISALAEDHSSGHAAETLGAAGGGGLYFGAGAAVASSKVDNTIDAELGSTTAGGPTGAASGLIEVDAGDLSTVVSDAYGAAGGAVGLGAAAGIAGKASSVVADIAPSTTVTNFADVMVMAGGAGSVSSSAIAGAAGIVSGSGAGATSTDSETVTADIGASSSISTTSGILVYAVATPQLSASAIGVAVGAGVGMGASVAMSNATVQVTADVGDNATISGGSLTVSALAATPTSGNTAYATSIAAGGGLLEGIQATYSQASDDSTVTAYGGANLTLPSANVTIAAENDTSQDATATGVAVGYIGAGATVSQVSSDAHTYAYLDAGANTVASNTGVLSITATGDDSNTSSATAGSGGIVAGAAAAATTSTTSTTAATLYGDGTSDALYFGGIGIQAMHTTTYSADGDAYQASAVGGSGGGATNTVQSNVTAEVGTNLIINSAAGDMNVIANDVVNSTDDGGRAGSGGIAAGAAVLSNTTITQTVAANVDSGTIFSLNDDPSTSTAKINIEATNSIDTTDTVSLTAAGLFAGGGGDSDLTANATDTVNIAANVELFSAGNIDIGTAANMTAANNADANLYGLVTGAGASTDTTLNANQNVNVGASTIEAWGLINIYAGQAGDGSASSVLAANATTTVYNEALIPITAEYKGTANATDNATLTLATGSQILGANNVFLGATQGSVGAVGLGTNYNPYLSIFSLENHDNHSNPGGSGAVVLDGLVAAGIHNQEQITISSAGVVTLSNGASYQGLTLDLVSDPNDFSPIVSYDHQVIQYANISSFNPYMQIVDELATLSGLTVAQVEALGTLGASTVITAQNDDAAGDVQRQINTLLQQAPFTANGNGPAYAFGNILVSAGNVSIFAQTLSGTAVTATTPVIIARDSTSIDFENQGTNFLDLSNLTISGVFGGHVNFTGGASSSSVSSHALSQDLTALTPTITVDASYNRKNGSGQPIDLNGNPLITTPDIYFDGGVTNENGLVNVTNQLGNVTIAQAMNAGTIEMTVPNGAITVNEGAGSIYNTNNDVASQWANVEYMPMDTLTAVDAAATYLGTFANGEQGEVYVDGNGSLAPYYHYWNATNGSVVNAAVTSYSGGDSPSTIFTARLLNLYYDSSSLYSAIFLPVGGANNSGGVSPLANSAWQRHQYQGEAYGNPDGSGDSGPFNCSGCGPYFETVQLQSQVINGVTATAAVNPPPSLVVNGGKGVILSAGVLNIDGTIESGQSSNYSVDIGTNAENYINGILNNTNTSLTLAQAKTNAAAGNYINLSGYISTVGGGDTLIGAQYDVLTRQVLLNNVVQGAGGYVYLNGKIISTSTNGSIQGNIIINGGAGTVNVDNTTGIALVTNTINTGVSAASVVEIVDQTKNLTTWYLYNAGASANQQVSQYQEAGVSNTSYTLGTLVAQMANSDVEYLPTANQLYQWVDTAALSRPNNGNTAAYGWNFSTNVSANAANADYTRQTSVYTAQPIANCNGQNCAQANDYQETVSATGVSAQYTFNTGNKVDGTDFSGNWYQEIYYNLSLTLTNTVNASYPIGIHFNGGAASNVSVASNASVLVNGPINNLKGNTSITTTGANSAILVGAAALVSGVNVTLTAPGGIGAIGATSVTPLPVQLYGGALTATSTDEDIAISATGSLTIDQVIVSPTTPGDAPAGSVYLSATGDINSASTYNLSAPIVVGKNIEIDSSGGAIGAITSANGLTNINPLVIEATTTTLGNGSLDGGVLNSRSSTGAYIVQSTGDLRLGSISSSGPVFLEAAGSDHNAANILNGQTTGGLTAAQTAALQTVWANLDLVAGSGAATVSAYESLIDGAYNDYWQLRNIAFGADGTYNMTATGSAAIANQIAAQEGISATAVTATQIQTEATTRFEQDEYLLGLKTAAQLGVSLDALFGTAAGQTSQFQAAPDLTVGAVYNQSFRYILPTNSALYGDLTSGSSWTQDQLNYTVSASAANGALPPSISQLPLNIGARQVMLYAPTGSIGSLATPTTFSFTSDDDSSLTGADKQLLSSAGPGQLTVTSTTNSTTGIVSYSVSVSEQSLVIVSPLGPVSAKAESQIYLGSASNLLLGGISDATFGPITQAESAGVQTIASGNVRLDAVDSIVGGVAGQVAISGDIADLTLIAETGSIGQAPSAGTNPSANQNALLLALSGASIGQLDQAVAAQGIYLNQTTGDLILGNITSGQGSAPIQLAALGSIYAESQFTDRSAVHISGSALDLRAGGEVSFNNTAFQPLQVEISGAVTGSAVGNMTILSPASDLNVGQAGAYGALTSGGALILDTTAGALAINADVTSTNALELLANGAVTFAAGTSAAPVVAQSTSGAVTLISATLSMGAYSSIDAAGAISVTTTGDATLGQLNSSLSPAANATAPSISVSAGGLATSGAILSNGDGRENVVANAANGDISLSASDGIGSSTHALVLDTTLASLSSTGGDIFVSTPEALHVTTADATLGSLAITGAGALTLDTLTAGTTLGVTSTGGGVTIGTATSGETQTLKADMALAFATLTSTAGDVDATSTMSSIAGGSLTAYGSASLTSATSNTGATATATNGSVTLAAGTLGAQPSALVWIDWTNVGAGMTLSATSGGALTLGTVGTGSAETIHASGAVGLTSLTATAGTIRATSDDSTVTIGTAMSGGTQTIEAAGAVGFATLTSTGGDIGVTSTGGAISGTTVTANGSANLAAYGDNTGTSLTAQTGGAFLSSTTGKIDWATVNAGTTFGATATAGAIALGSATSGGTQTIEAQQDIVYATLTATGDATDPGDVYLQSVAGAVRGGSIQAHGFVSASGAGIYFDDIDALAGVMLDSSADIVGTRFASSGPVLIDAAGAIDIADVSAGSIALSTPGDISFHTLTVATAADLASNNLTIGTLTQAPGAKGPLDLSITGYQGGIGTSANLTIDAPNGIYIPQLRERNAVITTTALQITMGDPTIIDTFLLTTPDQILLFDDASARPLLGNNVQFYQPDDDFYAVISNRSIRTDSYIVQYDAEAQVQQDFEGALINGPSFVRDFDRLGRDGEQGFDASLPDDDSTSPWYFPVEAFDRHLAAMNWRPVKRVGSGPAVNIEGAEANFASAPAGFTAVFTRKKQ